MGTSWSEKKRDIRPREKLPRHFCGSCTALRAEDDEVCIDCRREQPADGWSPLESAYDPFLGRVLNQRYVIDKIEGCGSSSTIYRARSLKVPKRFAIKMVKLWRAEEGVSEQVRTRLEREVRAVGMLRNPHIVRVYELLELDQNWVALVMDHIDGYTLEQLVEQEGAIEVERACALLRQVANGLCEAHDVGMIHRDVKPANLMVERMPDGDDFAYLLDFGVVLLEGDSKLTQGFLGTPLYASPEQASATKLDPRSDIYSLGATFYYMLTGHAPFESDRTLDVLKSHVYDTPPRLSDKRPDGDFSPALEALVASMLAKSPELRPANLLQVIKSLQRVLDGEETKEAGLARGPEESANFANPLGLEDSCGGARRTLFAGDSDARAGHTASFADRLRTATGLRHVGPSPHQLSQPPFDEAPAAETPAAETVVGQQPSAPGSDQQHRFRLDSGEVASFHETNPRGFERPSTHPGVPKNSRDIAVKSTVQFLPQQLDDERLESEELEDRQLEERQLDDQQPESQQLTTQPSGIPFARAIRTCAAADETLVAFVDGHNEVWLLRNGELEPICNTMERVTALTTTAEALFIGLADGTINRLSHDRLGEEPGEFEPIFREEQGRAITALSAPTGGGKLLASVETRTLHLAMLRRQRDPWVTLDANRPVAATAVSPRGAMFAVASTDGSIRASTTEAPTKTAAEFRVDADVVDMSFSHDGHLLAVMLDDGRLPIFQVLYGRQISELSPDCPRPHSLFFSRENILHGLCTAQGHISFHNLTLAKAAAGE